MNLTYLFKVFQDFQRPCDEDIEDVADRILSLSLSSSTILNLIKMHKFKQDDSPVVVKWIADCDSF